MNGINSIRPNVLDVNSTRDNLGNNRKKLAPVAVIEHASTTDSEQKRNSTSEKAQYSFNFNKQSNIDSELISTDSKFYRTGLLNSIYDKMSGNEPRFKPGSYVEYFA